jgi:hypothetical protein
MAQAVECPEFKFQYHQNKNANLKMAKYLNGYFCKPDLHVANKPLKDAEHC